MIIILKFLHLCLLVVFDVCPYEVSITSKPTSGGAILLIVLVRSVYLKSQRVMYIFKTNVIRHQIMHTLSEDRFFFFDVWT